MPNIHCSRDAVKTVWHEVVGHKGMRGLLGDKFNDYMRGLWMDLDNPVNKELREYVRGRMAKEPMSMYDAIEEYLAEAAEKGKGEPGFWNNIRNKVTDALHEIGYRIFPNVKDVKYMLWLAKNVQKRPNDPVWKMRAEAAKWKIEHEKTEYHKAENGMIWENDGKSHPLSDMTKEEWLEANDGKIHYRTAPSAATALDRYHQALKAHGYMATEAFMDNMLSVDKLMRALDPSIKKIEDVDAAMNPYMLYTPMQGMMAQKADAFERDVMKPLDKAMAKALQAEWDKTILSCKFSMLSVVQKPCHRPHRLTKGSRLPRNGDEEMSGSWIHIIIKRMAKTLQAPGQLTRLVEQNVVACRDDEHRGQRLQCGVARHPRRHERIVRIAACIGLIEGFEQFGIVAIARGIAIP